MENVFIVDKEDESIRIDIYIAEELNYSRNAVQRLIESGNITINGKAVKSNYKIRAGDIITVRLPEPAELKIEPENIPLDIVFEDKDVIIINKPQGMVVHPAPGHYSGTLVNGLLYHCGDSLSGINGILRPGIVHRIDKDTSGILAVAKNDTAHRGLSTQLAEHSILRQYTALVYNNIKENSGTVDKPIARHKTERKKMTVTEKGGKRAITHYKVLKRFGKYTLIEAVLETGRTHQIRVHMSYIGYPLLGDSVYSKARNSFSLSGQALHAKLLGFIHPTTNEYMEFQSELPDYFKRLISALEEL